MKRMFAFVCVLLLVFIVACGSKTVPQNDAADSVVPQQPSDAMARLAALPPPPQVGVDPSVGENQPAGAAGRGDIVGQATGSAAPSPCDLFFTLSVNDIRCNSGHGYLGNYHIQSLSEPHTNLSSPSVVHNLRNQQLFRFEPSSSTEPDQNTYSPARNFGPMSSYTFITPAVGYLYLKKSAPIPSWAVERPYDLYSFNEKTNDIYVFDTISIDTQNTNLKGLVQNVPSDVVVFPSGYQGATDDKNLVRPVMSQHQSYFEDIYLWRYGYIYKESLPNSNPGVVGNWERFEWHWPNNDPSSPDYNPARYPLATVFDDEASRKNWLPLTRSPIASDVLPAGTSGVLPLTGPDGVQYLKRVINRDWVHPRGENLVVTDQHLQFDYTDDKIDTKIGSIIAFACICVDDKKIGTPTGFPSTYPYKCSNQGAWLCNNATIGATGVSNGRWMLSEFTAREARIGTAPPAVN